jgi:uncharacterized protein (TIGR03437 family)
VLDISGAEVYASLSAIAILPGGNPLLLPENLPDGAYKVEVCVLKADLSGCDSVAGHTQTQYFISDAHADDSSSWTKENLVIIVNGPNYPDIGKESLGLSPGQPYGVITRPGAIAISGLPNTYTEVSLTDGQSTRLFPNVPDAINVWNWKIGDSPSLLGVLDPATFTYNGNVVPGGWSVLWGVGMTHGNPNFVSLVDNAWPTVAGDSNEKGQTRVIFSTLDGSQQWQAPMSYVDLEQINVIVPNELKPGQTVNVQVELNGTLSNPRQMAVVAAQPSIFMTDPLNQVPAARDAITGQLITADNPAVPGEYVAVYGTGFGAVSGGSLSDGELTPLSLYSCNNPLVITLGGMQLPPSFCGLTPTTAGLYQVNVQVPNNVSKAQASASISLTVGGVSANTASLPLQQP